MFANIVSPASFCFDSLNFILSRSCCWCFYFVEYTVCICQEGGMPCKVGIRIIFPADLAREIATKRAPTFMNSNAVVLGWITICLSTSPSPTVIPWHWWIAVAHQSLNEICLRLKNDTCNLFLLEILELLLVFRNEGLSTIIRFFYHDNRQWNYVLNNANCTIIDIKFYT